jgi:hypothetical protein
MKEWEKVFVAYVEMIISTDFCLFVNRVNYIIFGSTGV